MAKQTEFNKFISDIEPSQSTVTYISRVQNTLREYLSTHETYRSVHVDTFLSGSYAKHTSIRPVLHDGKRDVDIIVVTNHTNDDKPSDVLNELHTVLLENADYETAVIDGQAVTIEMSGINIDVVPVIVDEDDDALYYIGDVNTEEWIKTDPKGHKAWATSVNKDNCDAFKPLVKIIKWWRRKNCPDDTNYPKGITLEKIIADNLGDATLSTENLLISTMQSIIAAYKESYVDVGINPIIQDPSDKIDDNDLLAGYSTGDFKAFVEKLTDHISLLDNEGTDNAVWRKILGESFPAGTSTHALAEYNLQSCLTAPHRQKLRYPYQGGASVFISAKVRTASGEEVDYQNNGEPLAKNCTLVFTAITGAKPPYQVKWQVVNTGEEARNARGLRGGFENSDIGINKKKESTLYTGSHSVQCFVICRNACIARSRPFIVNII